MAITSADANGLTGSLSVKLATNGIFAPWPLRTKVFLLVLAIILCFGTGLQYWNHKKLYENELRLVNDKHLVIASNLSLTLSRYARDVSLVFLHQALNSAAPMTAETAIGEDTDMMAAMDLDGFTVLSPENEILSEFSLTGIELAIPDAAVLDELRLGTNERLHGVQMSDLQRIGDSRYFILGYNLPGGGLAIGYLNTRYVKTVQNRISFGELGHSAIFDSAGTTVAHPVKKAEENMMDASGIPIVKRMLNQETGVDQFYSPPLNADMIAGFSFVPETGWAVMVPQPLSELVNSVSTSLRQTELFIFGVSLLLAFLGWILTHLMVRPIQSFTSAALKLADGQYSVELPKRERSSLEMHQLNEALKCMVEKMRTANTELRSALDLKEKENKHKSDFLVIASHELRNPLSGVIGMLAVCREMTKDEELAKYLDIARRSATHLNSIVDEMVNFAQEQTDKVLTKAETFDPAQEFYQIATLYETRANQAGLAFHYSAEENLDHPVITDRYRLFQVVGNLLENAIKYTREGSVSMSVGLVSTANDGAEHLDIRISDTGIGIAEDDLERIFDPFFQVDGSFSRTYNGLGIGLAITKSAVDRLGGKIHCTSVKGKGTEFTLLIPIAR
jgi:signal transduction histidine kinase